MLFRYSNLSKVDTYLVISLKCKIAKRQYPLSIGSLGNLYGEKCLARFRQGGNENGK